MGETGADPRAVVFHHQDSGFSWQQEDGRAAVEQVEDPQPTRLVQSAAMVGAQPHPLFEAVVGQRHSSTLTVGQRSWRFNALFSKESRRASSALTTRFHFEAHGVRPLHPAGFVVERIIYFALRV